LQFKAIKADEEQWQKELAAAEIIRSNIEAVQNGIHDLIGKVLIAIDYWFFPSEEHKKEILNALLDKFVLYADGRVELRLKLPVNEAQVADAIITSLGNELSSRKWYCRFGAHFSEGNLVGVNRCYSVLMERFGWSAIDPGAGFRVSASHRQSCRSDSRGASPRGRLAE